MIAIQPDSAIVSSISILREKKQFVNKINFGLNCIMQSLRVTNTKYDDNITHILLESLYKDLALVLSSYEDEEVCQNILAILLKLVSFKTEVGVGISESMFLKGVEKNINSVVKNVELMVALINKISHCEVNSNWISERDKMTGKFIVLKMSDDNVSHLLKYIEQENIKITKTEYFIALSFYKNKRIIKSILYQIYKNIDNKTDRLSNQQMNSLLNLVDVYIGDCELCYIIYFILSKFYTFKQAVSANSENKLILAYVYALGEANMEFQPAFTDEKSFIYTLAILSEGDRFTQCYIKVLMPKFDMIKSEASELKFLSELKKIGLKDNIKQLYEPLKQTLSQSKNPRLVRQYEYLLKTLNNKHEISKSKQTVIIDDSAFKSQKQFTDYFTSILLLITLFQANLLSNQTQKFLQQTLRFIKMDRMLSVQYLPFLYQFVIKLESEFSKNELYHNLLTDIYIQCLESEFKPNKIAKLEEIIVRTFSAKGATWHKQKDSVKLGVIIPSLIINPPTFKVSASKLTALTVALRNGQFNINTKLHLIFKLFKASDYSAQMEDVVIYFLEYLIEVLQKEKDTNKVRLLDGIIKWMPKLEKNHVYNKLIENRTIQFVLERLFYILVSLVKTLQCDALFEIIFELEQWIPLQELLRKNQADKIVTKSLENYSDHTADIIELCEVIFGEPESEYYQKAAPVREAIHKNIRKNLLKYSLEDLSAYDSSLELFGEFARKTKFEIKHPNPNLKQLQQRCNQFKGFAFYQDNPSEDPTIIKVIADSFKDVVQLSTTPQAKGDSTLDSCARSMLVSLMWAFQNSQTDIPIGVIENINILLSSPVVSPLFVKKALQAIATLPHTFNLAKIPFQKLYDRYTDNIQIIEVLNDLIKIIADSNPKALNNLKFESFIDQTFYFLVFESDSDLVQRKLKLIETICLVDSRWNEFILGKVFVLEKIIKADLSNPVFYRPKIIQSILNIMDQLTLLKGLAFQLCKLFEKYIDESEICYMILLNLKEIPSEEVTTNLNQRSLAYILINSEDKDLLEMSKNLMAEYKEMESNKQEEFVKAFTKKNYDKCEQLILEIEKPHEVEFVKNEVNAFLGSEQITEFPKVKQFLMTNKKAEPVLYECEAFYKDEALVNDFVQKVQDIDGQYQVFSLDNNGEIESHKSAAELNVESIAQMLKKGNFIAKYVDSIQKGNEAEQVAKVRLICLLSKIPELTELCDTTTVRKLLQNNLYQALFYNSGLAFHLHQQHNINVLSLINHLQSHLLREDGSKPEQNQYMCKLLKLILNHKPKNKQYFNKLLETVSACRNIINPNNIDILTNMSHQVLLLLHDHRKGLKFATAKQENYFNNLQLILVNFYQTSMTFSDIHNVSLKTMDRLFGICTTPFQNQMFVYILKRYLDAEAKDKDRLYVIQRYPLEDKVDRFTEKGRAVYKTLSKQIIQMPAGLTELLTKFEGDLTNDLANKQQTVQTLSQYSKLLNLLIEKKQNADDGKKITSILEHLSTICGNTFYYNKIIKQKLIEKLISLYSIKPNGIISLIMRISHNKSLDSLKTEVVMKFLKDRLKEILEEKPQNSEDLTRIMTIFTNSQYTTFDSYFKNGLYSTIIEILKAKVMEKNILKFINSFKMDERLVNQLYQRGLIQLSIQKIGSSSQDEGEQWITLLGRICINPAIQNKLLGIKIHEQIYKKYKDTKKISMIEACATFFTNITFNNEPMVKWTIEKKIIKSYPEAKTLPDSTMVEIIKNIYSVAYNNPSGKKHLIEINAKEKIYDYYNKWAAGLKSTHLVAWNVYKTLSTLLLDAEFSEGFIADKFIEVIGKEKILINSEEQCFNLIELLHNLLANINKPKLYQQLKASKIYKLFRQVRKNENSFLLKHVEMLIVTTCLLVKWELLESKQIDVVDFESVLRTVLKHDVSDELIKTLLMKLIQCITSSKDVRVTAEIVFILEKIAIKRKSDIFMPMIIQIIENVKDIDIIRNVMSRGELSNIICDVYPKLPKDKASQEHITNCLIMMANSHWIADIIITYIGKLLLESPDTHKLKILDALCQYTSTSCFAIQLNGIIILGDILRKSPPPDQQYYILKIGRQMFKCKDVNVSEKQLWTEGMNKVKPDTKTTQLMNDLKILFNNKKTVLTQQIKQELAKGLLCTMYKTDGSVSKLILTITKSLNEINCIHEGSSNVKPKWRVPINDIKEIVYYNDEAKFYKSHFYKSNFLGKKPEPERCLSIIAQNNELHILFPSKEAKQRWVSSLMLVQQYVSQMLLMLR